MNEPVVILLVEDEEAHAVLVRWGLRDAALTLPYSCSRSNRCRSSNHRIKAGESLAVT